jgi:hypothetical protein
VVFGRSVRVHGLWGGHQHREQIGPVRPDQGPRFVGNAFLRRNQQAIALSPEPEALAS